MKGVSESIRKRYFTTLLSQGIQMFLGVIEASLVPRYLGPSIYGNFRFLLTSASSFRDTADLGAQQMVFTKSSKLTNTGALTKLYGLWLILQLLAIISFIGLFAATRKIDWLWPKQRINQIILVTILEWMMAVATRIAQIGDSKGLTVRTQTTVASISLITAFSLLGLAAWRRLDFYSYVLVLIITAATNATFYAMYLFVRHKLQIWEEPLRGNVRPYLRQWWAYSSPIVAYNIYSIFLGWLDAYLIQRLYGSKEQAYFALSATICGGALIFTAASVNVYWREVARSLSQKDLKRTAHIYQMFSRMLFFLTLGLTCWLSINARFLLPLFAGKAYLAATPVLMIMAFYPLQQTLGQINTVLLLAAEQTSFYRNLSIALSLPGLLSTYILLAPRHSCFPGLELGAIGLAFKMIALGLLTVQFYEYRVCQILALSYLRTLFHKLFIISLIGGLAWAILIGLPWLLPVQSLLHKIVRLTGVSLVYLGALLLLVHRFPHLCGLDREQIQSALGSWRYALSVVRQTRNSTC